MLSKQPDSHVFWVHCGNVARFDQSDDDNGSWLLVLDRQLGLLVKYQPRRAPRLTDTTTKRGNAIIAFTMYYGQEALRLRLCVSKSATPVIASFQHTSCQPHQAAEQLWPRIKFLLLI